MDPMARPNRSNVHLPPEEEAKREEETREYFDGIAPKRHSKPMRSEYSTLYQDVLAGDEADPAPIPELSKFHQLETQPMGLVYETSEAGEEFVETEYYKDLNCVDKQHHTTGTGFIKVDKGNSNGFSLGEDDSAAAADSHPSCRGNPATNEWIPAAEPVIPASVKPMRSDI